MSAPSSIVWGSVVGSSPYQSRIGIYVKLSSTATQTTRHTEVWFWSKYSVSDSSNTFYYDDNATSATTSKGAVTIKTTVKTGSGWSTTNQVKIAEYDYTFTRGTSASTRSVAAKLTGIDVIGETMSAVTTYTIPALASYTVAYNANGENGAPSSQTKTYGKALTLSSTAPSRTGYTFKGWATSASGSVSYAAGASYTKNASVTLYAVWEIKTYTVSYNANGGNGAPSSQTKTYGKALTLSGTKPTKTGHTFNCWNTKDDGTGTNYASGSSYTGNANLKLYAKWTANTYTVTYNANGGTGAPGNQTKTYGANLTLSGTIPTRTGYTFKGWATSASGSVSYAAGGTYTNNANITLFAVWESTYFKPKISSVSVYRSNASGTALASGKYARVKFKWSTSNNVSSITIAWRSASSGSGSTTVTASGKSDEVDIVVGGGQLSTDASYSVTITVADSGGNWSAIRQLPSLKFTIDCLAGGNGVAFGKVAELKGVADFGFKARFRDDATFENRKCIYGIDQNGTVKEAFCAQNSNGNTVIGYDNYDKKSGNTNIYGYDVYIGVSNIDSPGAYRPYYKKGDTINITFISAGYITGSAQNLSFWVPISKPIIGDPTVSAASASGFVLRQGGKYTHGSAASTFVFPSSYEVTATYGTGIYVKAVFSTVTNAVNNDSIGVYWSGTITFS